MDERTLLESIDWVAHGFEVVQSVFAGWQFSAPDAVAAFGLHGALLIGPLIGSGRMPRSEPDAFDL
jgi:2-oxo-3-hexenedioate decarboxylase